MKKLKLRKEVKFITASIALGLTLCAVPTLKVIAEDDSVDTSDLYTRLMAAETLEEFENITDSATAEEIALITEEQINDIQTRYETFGGADDTIEDTVEIIDAQYDSPVPCEDTYTTVNFTNVAPLVNNVGLE